MCTPRPSGHPKQDTIPGRGACRRDPQPFGLPLWATLLQLTPYLHPHPPHGGMTAGGRAVGTRRRVRSARGRAGSGCGHPLGLRPLPCRALPSRAVLCRAEPSRAAGESPPKATEPRPQGGVDVPAGKRAALGESPLNSCQPLMPRRAGEVWSKILPASRKRRGSGISASRKSVELPERVHKPAILNILISGKCFFGTKWMLEGSSTVNIAVAFHFSPHPSRSIQLARSDEAGGNATASPRRAMLINNRGMSTAGWKFSTSLSDGAFFTRDLY